MMAPHSRSDEPNESRDQIGSDSSSAVSEIFSDNGSDSNSNSVLELDSEEYNDDNVRYSDGMQVILDRTRVYWDGYCQHIGRDPNRQWQCISNSDETVRFLYGFFSWWCDIQRGKYGRRCLGIIPVYKTSLELFWKRWRFALKHETATRLSKKIMTKVHDVIAIVAEQKGLQPTQRPMKHMYIEDAAEFARALS
ncbi:hypothetical protein IFM61392_09792 [Aspergillus lentulus]|nr:hypothetical protein IFM61392_09792 [Aspergillus lentulus]